MTQLRAEILVGQRYRFVQRMGTAQFTETWKAFDTRLGRPVALQHYAFIDAKRYADGYSLMDAHLRSLNSAADYQSWFVDKISVKPISVDVTSQTDTEAVVHSVVDTTDRVDGQNVTKQVSEEFVLHAENGAWRIDQVSRL